MDPFFESQRYYKLNKKLPNDYIRSLLLQTGNNGQPVNLPTKSKINFDRAFEHHKSQLQEMDRLRHDKRHLIDLLKQMTSETNHLSNAFSKTISERDALRDRLHRANSSLMDSVSDSPAVLHRVQDISSSEVQTPQQAIISSGCVDECPSATRGSGRIVSFTEERSNDDTPEPETSERTDAGGARNDAPDDPITDSH